MLMDEGYVLFRCFWFRDVYEGLSPKPWNLNATLIPKLFVPSRKEQPECGNWRIFRRFAATDSWELLHAGLLSYMFLCMSWLGVGGYGLKFTRNFGSGASGVGRTSCARHRKLCGFEFEGLGCLGFRVSRWMDTLYTFLGKILHTIKMKVYTVYFWGLWAFESYWL